MRNRCQFLVKNKIEYTHETFYALDLERIVYEIGVKQIEKIFAEKHSIAHLRVLRALIKMEVLDEKSLQELCLLSSQDIRTCLMTLLKEGLIEKTEIVEERKKIFAYRLRLGNYVANLVPKLYKVVHNLLMRLCNCEEQIELMRHGGGSGSNLSHEERVRQLEKAENDLKKLSLALLDVDNVLMVFTEF